MMNQLEMAFRELRANWGGSCRHKLFFPRADFQMAESKVLFDMACDRILERFKLET